MNTTQIRDLIAADNATLPTRYEIISDIVTDAASETASFATAETIEGSLGTYTVHSVRTVVLAGPDTGYVLYVDGCEDISRSHALAVVADFARRAA